MRNWIVGALCVALAGCSGLPVKSSLDGGQLKDSMVNANDKKFIRTKGIGVPPEDAVGKTKTYRRGTSRNAALVSARYEMLQIIKGIHLEGGLTLGNLMQKDSLIKERADRIIHGAVEVQSEWTSDDGCVVVIELEKAKIDEIVQQDKEYESRDKQRPVFLLPGIKGVNTKDDGTFLRPLNRGDGKSPMRCFAWGICVPGGGYMYNNQVGKGILTLVGVSAFIGIGSSLYNKKSDPNDFRNQSPTKGEGDQNQNRTIGIGLMIAGAVVHLFAAADSTLDVYSRNFEIYMDDRSTGVKGTYKFGH